MFEKIGKIAARFRFPIIGAWVVAVVLVVVLAPSLSEVATSDQASFLPQDEPSVVAGEIAAEYFPDQISRGQAVLVVQNENGSMRDQSAQSYLADLTAWLRAELPADLVSGVTSPSDPAMASQLISGDGRVAMILVGLRGSIEDQATVDALDVMQAHLNDAPEGIRGYVTGSVAVLNDYMSSAMESADRTAVITVALVIALLLIIYRSPVSPVVPLVTIGTAYLLSRGLVAWFARFGWTVSSITDVFMVVLLFGAGTDYCLFLVSRFREYIADDLPGPEAAHRTLGRVGETITSSAGTVIVGMLAMSFAEMRLFASTGPSLAVAISVAVLAGLTLTPALLAALGRFAFWPGKPRRAKEGRFWGRLARWVTARPWLPLALAAVFLVPLAIFGSDQQQSFDMLADLPDDVPSKMGFELLSAGFGAGEMQPLDIIITEIPHARSPEGIAHIHVLALDLMHVEGVADVRSLTFPAGKAQPELGAALRVDGQLRLIAGMIDQLSGSGVDPDALAEMDLSEAVNGLDAISTYFEELATAIPELTADPDYRAAIGALDELRAALDSGRQLLVSYQLREAAAGLGLARGQMETGDTTLLAATGDSTNPTALLESYLAGLALEHPTIAEMDGYDDVLAGLDSLEAAVGDLGEMLLVSAQLDAAAQAIDSMAQALDDNPMALMPSTGGPAPNEQVAALGAYLDELGEAFPVLAATERFQTADDLSRRIEQALATMDLNETESLLVELREALPLLSDAFSGLAATAAQTLPQETFVPQTPLPISVAEEPLQRVATILADLEAGLIRMAEAVAIALPEAIYVPSGEAMAGDTPAAEALLAEVDTLHSALLTLAERLAARQEIYFVPLALATVQEEGAGLVQLIDTYTTVDGAAARLQVVLADEPFAPQALDTVQRLRSRVTRASAGYVSGGTAQYLDMRDVMDRDTVRTMGLVLGGILVVLLLMMRSLVAPLYMIATILLSYGATLGITRLLFETILHKPLTWWAPFLIFVVLVALGMDYNIFLMGRVKEEVAGVEEGGETSRNRTRRGIERAVQRTGGIITSAGIIMAGTFAAMMASSLLGLVQLAFAVTVGMLLDTFVIRTTLVPAIAALLDHWNWWPGKGPGRRTAQRR